MQIVINLYVQNGFIIFIIFALANTNDDEEEEEEEDHDDQYDDDDSGLPYNYLINLQ